jgi:valyl-tRNA synthetase
MTAYQQPRPAVPDKPVLDGLEAVWSVRWEAHQVYRFDRAGTGPVFAIDTPPPTVSGSLHVGHVFSYTHTDITARFHRMSGQRVFYPIGWDDNGLPTERRVQNVFGVRCDPAVAYDPAFAAPERPGKQEIPISRRNFTELCERLTALDERAFEDLWRRIGLSVDWSLLYTTISTDARRVSQRLFLRNLARGEAYRAAAPTLWDVTFQTAVAQAELEDRDYAGAFHRISFHGPGQGAGRDAGHGTGHGTGGTGHGTGGTGHGTGGTAVWVETTRPELLPACVALVAHPSDPRYQELFGATVRTPVFGVEVPVLAHHLADPDKGSGIAMVCTFGDLTDVTWWRELELPLRAVIGRDGRMGLIPPDGVPGAVYAELAGKTVFSARARMVELLRDSGDLDGAPVPVTRPVKFYERGDKPLEIVTSGQWYIRNGGRDPALRDVLLARGRELTWHPPHMRVRYENWVAGLAGDWLVSRQRFFGVPFPVWYPLDESGEPVYGAPVVPAQDALPVDPASDPAPGYTEAQRGVPGGFIADPDVMDTWATSSLTPLIAARWGTDDELFAMVFPMRLRPQSHEIIRTWLFSTVTRSHLEFGELPWSDVAISGWILDPDRKKMSKSKGNVVAPTDLLDEYGADAVRYWAAKGRYGVDTTFDPGQLKIGRRLAVKILNVAKFVLSFDLGEAGGAGAGGAEPGGAEPGGAEPGGAEPGAEPGIAGARAEPLDLSLLAALDTTVRAATAALDGYEHASALDVIERFFWTFCDDYVELVKTRAYGDGPGAASARRTLRHALGVLLRLFAPYLPFVTEEAWSWWRTGSIHHAPWPAARDLAVDGLAGDPATLGAAATVLGDIRKAKTAAKVSLRAPVARVVIRFHDPAALATATADLRAAGNVADLVLQGMEQGMETRDPDGPDPANMPVTRVTLADNR